MLDETTLQKRIDPRLLDLIKQVKYNAAGFYFVSFLIPIISYLSLEIGGLELGVVFSLRTIGFTISALFAGFLSNTRSLRAKLIFGASIGRFLSYILIFFSFIYNLYWMMALGLLILGLGAGFFWTPFESTIADATDYKFRSEAYGRFSQQSGIGGFIGATIGFTILMFAERYNLSPVIAFSPLLLYSISNIYAGIRVLQLAPKVKYVDIEEERAEIKEVVQKAIIYSFIFLLVILFIESLIGSLVGSFIQYFLLEYITQDIQYIILAYVPGGVISIILAPRLGKLADKLNPIYTLGAASVLGAIMTWLLINSTQIWQFSIIFLIDSAVVATASLMLTKIISTISKNRRGTVFGFHDSLTNLGHIIGPIVGGVLWDVNTRSPFILSIIIEGALALLYPFAILILGKNINIRSGNIKESVKIS